MAHCIIVGCGDVGSRLAAQLVAGGHSVTGVRRRQAELPAGVQTLQADVAAPACPAGWPEQVDYLVYAVAAGRGGEAAYQAAYVDGLRNVLGWLAQRQQRVKRLVFVSSTGVYGQSAGEWVDEDAETAPTGFSGRILLAAEQLALASDQPATWLRLAGIYGPGRGYLLSQAQSGAQAEPLQYGNRIHADDAASLLASLIAKAEQGVALAEGYIGVDDEPAPLDEVLRWLRAQLGVTEGGGELLKRRAGSKRCRNTRARALGWAPQYPSYREGYAALLQRAD
ncbi:NAD-dependent epimerase/dehydratase family protein [Atopomonas sediminilitoris]|uniref:NAD-dependent epimerase/dehydratase family protein n=1 Tax=Atopomonas sediminilitoris TaxID=2919919 RepID=UPI001F4E4CFF|nr:NAD-dependent epimerase/dehydratase family protein [Atopomonas sediminilitoris]MCJ8168194.1 NAD(P)H-binding protein [Atopomonas sediminilitoris]